MSTSITYDDLVNLLYASWLPRAEVWIRDYLPSGQVLKVMVKDLPLVEGFLPGTEEIYFLSRENYSMEMAEIMRSAGIPVFGPSGNRLD